MEPLALGAAAVGVVTLAWRAGALTGPGAGAALAVGLLVLAGTGWRGGLTLLVFFASSSALSHFTARAEASHHDGKGSRRDPWQVLANGGAAALAGLLEWRTPGLGLWLQTVALAAAAADTWATSLGAVAPGLPRHLLSGAVVPKGTNGGISVVGSLGAVAGALLVGGVGVTLAGTPARWGPVVALGTAGMLLDSLLGAGWQGRWRCPSCAVGSERRVHRCGTPTRQEGGWAWLDNDRVNALATTLTVLVAWGAWSWWGWPS